MAGLGVKKFNPGDILSAADVNGYFMDQSIGHFDDAAARSTFFGSNPTLLFAGRLTYLRDTESIWIYDGANWTEQTAIIADNSVSALKLQTDSVETLKIKDGNVTTEKIADSAITNDKLAPVNNGTFTPISGTTYTIALADFFKTKTFTSSSAVTVTIPSNATLPGFSIGTEIYFLQLGTGQVGFSPASGVTLRSDSSRTKIKTQYSSVSLLKIDTNEWVLTGNLGA
jgi:hypothetical protein